jgi:hypothetical protein
MYRAALVVLAACSFRPFAEAPDAPIGDDDAPIVRDARPDAAADAPPDAPPIPFCDPGDDTLVACYPFENSVADAKGHDPNVMNNISFVTGEVGQAVMIGPTSELDVPDSPDFNVSTFTLEAWIDPNQLPTSGARGGILDCEGQFGFFLHENGDVSCSATANLQVAAAVPANQWTHVACTYDGTQIAIYASGALVGATGSAPPGTGGTSGITLGGNNPPNGGSPLNGGLDQLRFFNVARSATDICADAGRSTCP